MNKFFLNRFLRSVILGILFGLLCVYFASTKMPEIWGTVLMWSILFNRFLIGALVGLLGVYTVHPILRFKLYPAIRGLFIGMIVSLQIGIDSLMGGGEQQWMIFWSTIIVGGIYGLIIDLLATRCVGDGKKLLD